ncbi:MAG: 2-oxoacid:acceptor oxidoreductase family protein [Nitrososphaerota archaeon]
MLKIRFHGRGGQGVKTSSRILGRAAFLDGFTAQDSPIYGAERRGAPVVSFTRISKTPITERGFIFDPDIVIVMDETLLNDWLARPLEGVKRGGVVFVNAQSEFPSLEGHDDKIFITYDLTGEALEILGRPIISSPAAAAAAKITGLITKSSILEATAEELVELDLKDELLEKNIQLAAEVYDVIPSPVINTQERETITREVCPLEYEPVSWEEVIHLDIANLGNSALRRTGNWRIFKPIVDPQKCTGCMLCIIYCPDSCISLDENNKAVINYDNCKGCMICLRECPLRAISSVREVRVYA